MGKIRDIACDQGESAGQGRCGQQAVYGRERAAQVPGKYDLNLGRGLVIDFAYRHISDDIDRVQGYFRRSGAYSRFKDILDRRGLLERWYEFEEEAKERALREWGEENTEGQYGHEIHETHIWTPPICKTPEGRWGRLPAYIRPL